MWRTALVVMSFLSVVVATVVSHPLPARADLVITKDIPYRTVDGYTLTLDVVQPGATGGTWPAVLVAHGGTSLSVDTALDAAEMIAGQGFVVFLPEYRPICNGSPPCGESFPVQLDDLEAAMDWIAANGASYLADTTHIGALGTSGGATLVETLGTLAPPQQRPDAAVGWSGLPELWRYDLSPNPDTLAKQLLDYLGCSYVDCPDHWHEASAISYAAADSAAMYPAVGLHERIIPWQESADFVDALHAAAAPAFFRGADTESHGGSLGAAVAYGCCTTVQDESLSFLHTYLDSSPQADLAVTGSAPSSSPVGTQITYDLTVTNAGPAWGDSTVLTEQLPPQVQLQSVTSSQGTCSGTTLVTCNLGVLPPNEDPATVTITVGATQAGTAVNAPQVSSWVGDPVTSNNSTELDVQILSGSSSTFSGELIDADGNPLPGQHITLSPPSGGRFVAMTGPNGSFSMVVVPDSYTLEVSGGEADGVTLPVSYDVSLPSFDLSQSVTQDLMLPLSILNLTVLGPGDNPVPKVSVNLPCTAVTPFALTATANATGTECSGGTPNAIGAETLTLLAAESVSLTATPPGPTGLLPATDAGLSIAGPTNLTLNLPPTPSVFVSDPSVVEGGSGTTTMANFVLSLSNPSPDPVTVGVSTGGGTATAGADYQALPLTDVTFAPGETSKTVPVTVYGDALHEGNENFNLKLSLADTSSATLGDSTSSAAIVDDEGPLTLNVSDGFVLEGNSGTTTMPFTVALSDPPLPGTSVSVHVGTAGGSATAGSDYLAVPTTTLTWTSSDSLQKTVNVVVNGDTTAESNETLSLKLTDAHNATIADVSGTGTIVNDDGTPGKQPPPSLFVSDASAVEPGSGQTSMATFRVALSAPSSTTVTVKASTTDGTATGGLDYQALSATQLTFPVGTTEQDVQIPLLGDSIQEGNETFTLKLSSPSRAVVGDPSGTGTVIDDDGGLHLYVSDAWAVEGNGGAAMASFSVSLSNSLAPGQLVTVNVATGGGSAMAGVDYQAVPSTALTWTSSDFPVKTVSVTVFGDATTEPNESFFLTLSSPSSSVVIGDAQGAGTIVNDD
jgi:uncharacterized repeat protein (TIGR01451 family)